jgi:hypothetical protein
VTPAITERLKSLDIWVMADGMYFCVFVRDGCVAMVPRSDDMQGFADIGSSGLSTDDGLLYLVWRDEVPMLVGHTVERRAEADQVEKILRFSADLKAALGLD